MSTTFPPSPFSHGSLRRRRFFAARGQSVVRDALPRAATITIPILYCCVLLLCYGSDHRTVFSLEMRFGPSIGRHRVSPHTVSTGDWSVRRALASGGGPGLEEVTTGMQRPSGTHWCRRLGPRTQRLPWRGVCPCRQCPGLFPAKRRRPRWL